MGDTVTVWKRISESCYEPYATSRNDLRRQLQFWSDDAFCQACQVVVEREGQLTRQGVTSCCGFCGTELS